MALARLLLFLSIGLAPAIAHTQGPVPASQAQEARGTITGNLIDPDGDFVAHAQIVLTAGATSLSAVSDEQGRFAFAGVPPGALHLAIEAPGFAASETTATLGVGEALRLPELTLVIASTSTEVEVEFTRHDIAEEEIHAQETQRLVGVVPNFFVTYNWHAAPLTVGQKYKLAWRATWDPANIAINAAVAGLAQSTNAFDGYGPGALGYARRFGAINADAAIGTMLGGALFPALLHQDPRFFYMSHGSVWKRTAYALSTAFICRGDNGKWQPNYSSLAGNLSSGAISNLYYPEKERNGVATTFENGGLAIGVDAINNVIQELVLRRFTPHPPSYPQTP